MTRKELSTNGFVGWVTFDDLRRLTSLPVGGGIYVVCDADRGFPRFLPESIGGHFKGKSPTVSPEVLVANWVDGAEVLYIGKGDNLRRRLGELAKFGAGVPIGHWGGRLLWQLADSARFTVAWKETRDTDPLAAEKELIARFRALNGKPPFANDPQKLGR